jgi:TRAP-type mannitol/chloroaromatic compound transport system, small permease component
MLQVIHTIDRFTTWVGRSFSWLILLMAFGMGFEVLSRYLFNAPTAWAYDMSYILYGTLFMVGGAYTLSRNAHVRGDFLYRLWKPRTQAKVELTLYFLFSFRAFLRWCLLAGPMLLSHGDIWKPAFSRRRVCQFFILKPCWWLARFLC